jgi:hypothetical protein
MDNEMRLVIGCFAVGVGVLFGGVFVGGMFGGTAAAGFLAASCAVIAWRLLVGNNHKAQGK